MLLDQLDALRAKPAAARRRFVFIATSVLTALIVLIWFSVLLAGQSVQERSGAKDSELSAAITTAETSFFSNLKNTISDTFDTNVDDMDVRTSEDDARELPAADFESRFSTPPVELPQAATTSATTTPSTDTVTATNNSVIATTTTSETLAPLEEYTSNDKGFIESLLEETGQ